MLLFTQILSSEDSFRKACFLIVPSSSIFHLEIVFNSKWMPTLATDWLG